MTRPTRAAATKAKQRIAASPASDADADSVIVISDSSDDDASDAFTPGDADGAASSPDADADGAELDPESETSVFSEPDESDSGKRGTKRKRGVAPAVKTKAKATAKAKPKGAAVKGEVDDIEDLGYTIPRAHSRVYHAVKDVARLQDALLEWFEGVRDTRGMPWRKRYTPTATASEKAQRAYEVWVSEVMLQQTQVATVVDYWARWVDRWPTAADLAAADVEEVNNAWRGLGYYRRARGLLDGAKVVTGRFNGALPSDPETLEKDIPGVGRYTAGAICSIAYGVRTPIVDGNIHRVLTRLLGVHATQTAPATIKFLWDAAEQLVDALPRGLSRGIAGDWNQALMELGATVCRPVNPECTACPVHGVCKAYAELSSPPPVVAGKECDLCEPIPGEDGATTIGSVTVFPMKKVKKMSREENEVVTIVEWHGRKTGEKRWLFVKRPEKGLLAGLFEPPTTPVPPTASGAEHSAAGSAHLATLLAGPVSAVTARQMGAVPHIFSHINMTYHVHHLCVVEPEDAPPAPKSGTATMQWLDTEGVLAANVGTGVKKCWAAVYGQWGKFDGQGGEVKVGGNVAANGRAKGKPKATMLKAKTAAKATPAVKRSTKAEAAPTGGKVARKVAMPAMPKREREAT